MQNTLRRCVITIVLSMAAIAGFAQAAKQSGVVGATELKLVVPGSYFFADQVAPVQMRNAVALRSRDGHIVSAGLVDNSGYSSEIAQKYQGFLITSKKISVEGQPLEPGQYGFGFTKGKFVIMDVSAKDVLSVDFKQDEALKRPVPLKASSSDTGFRLYAGKKYVTLKID